MCSVAASSIVGRRPRSDPFAGIVALPGQPRVRRILLSSPPKRNTCSASHLNKRRPTPCTHSCTHTPQAADQSTASSSRSRRTPAAKAMPDRVPLVHRHRRQHHFHYEDPQAAMEEGAVAEAQHAHGGSAMSPLNAAAVGDGGGGARSKGGTPAADGMAGKVHTSPPASIGAVTPRNRLTAFWAGTKSPKAGPAVPPPRPPPHLSKSWPWILFGSLTLTFNAGYINTLTLNTIRAMPSAHVTGACVRTWDIVCRIVACWCAACF